MNNESLDHGDLFWVDLNPFLDEYVLAKVIDHSYFRETHRLGSPYYIYIYDYFVDDVNASIPKKVDRHLYAHPFNCKLYFYDGLWRLIPIRNEAVDKDEIVDQVMINARGGIIRNQVDLIFSDVNLTTLDIEYDVGILQNLELFDFYVDKEIQARTLIDVIKNRNLKIDSFCKENEEFSFFQYVSSNMELISHFPSYLQIEPKKRGFIDFDWRLLEKSKYKKDFRDMKSRDLGETPKYIFHYSVYFVFGLLDPVFRKYGYRATGRCFVSLLASLIYTHKILNTPIEIVDRVENSIFRLRFMKEEDRNKLVDFFHEEILDPHKVEKYLPLMDRDYIELFSGLKTDAAETVEHITDYLAEKSVSKYLFKYKYTKGTQKIYGLNINADVLYEDFTGLLMEYSDLPNGEFWAELMEAESSSMFNLTLEEDYEIDEEASNCDMHFYKKKDRDSIYKHLVENLKDKNSIKILLDRNNLQ